MFEQLQPVLREFVVTLATGLLAVLSAFLVALAKKGFDWISQKIDAMKSQSLREDARKATELLETVVTTTVTALQQSLGDDIKESLAKGDGKYTKEDLQNLKYEAIATIKHQLSESTTQILNGIYADLDSYICDLIEAAVHALKSKGSGTEPASTKKLLNE